MARAYSVLFQPLYYVFLLQTLNSSVQTLDNMPFIHCIAAGNGQIKFRIFVLTREEKVVQVQNL